MFDEWAKARTNKLEVVSNFIMEQTGVEELSPCSKAKIRKCVHSIQVKWDKANRHRERFLNNASWLEDGLDFNFAPDPPTDPNRSGGPQKAFKDCSLKVQTRKMKELVESTSKEELSKATELALRKAGKRDSAAIVKQGALFFFSYKGHEHQES